MVLKETKYMIERCTKLCGESPQFRSVLSFVGGGEDLPFCQRQPFARQPDDVLVKLKGLGIARGVKLTEATGANESTRE